MGSNFQGTRPHKSRIDQRPLDRLLRAVEAFGQTSSPTRMNSSTRHRYIQRFRDNGERREEEASSDQEWNAGNGVDTGVAALEFHSQLDGCIAYPCRQLGELRRRQIYGTSSPQHVVCTVMCTLPIAVHWIYSHTRCTSGGVLHVEMLRRRLAAATTNHLVPLPRPQ